jgi:hypothetical protein
MVDMNDESQCLREEMWSFEKVCLFWSSGKMVELDVFCWYRRSRARW